MPAPLHFERVEYLERLEKTKRRMVEAGIELLVVADPSNIYYLSGYDAWSFYVPQVLLVNLEDEQPLWYGRQMDVNAARLTAFMDEEHLVGYPDEYVQSAERHPMQLVAALIRERGGRQRRIGVELDAYYFTPRAYQALAAGLPGAEFVEVDLLVNWVRVVKSPAELGYMRQAAQIVERAMRTAIEAIAPGVRECDVAAEIYRAQIGGTAEFGGTYTSSPPFIPTGARASAPHLVWTDAPYQPGTPTTIELVGSRHRYHAPLGRTVFLGTPPPHVREVAEVVVEGLSAALDAIRPGVTCHEVAAVFQRTIARHGIEKPSRVGYSVGIAYPPTFGERTLSLRAGDATVLEPDMTLHLIPGIWLDDWGLVITESLRVTETGHETFCTIPRQLFVKA